MLNTSNQTTVTPALVVHYQELVLKRRNRVWFVDRLLANLREVTRGLEVAEIRPVMGRIEIALKAGARLDLILPRVLDTLGVASVAIAERVAVDLNEMTSTAVRLTTGLHPASFRVSVSRADKSFPMPSPDVERHIGGAVHDARAWPVNLSEPDLIVRVEILSGAAYVTVDRRKGLAGLPVGASGRVACLLSGGIDSPVAAFRLIRRGCRVVLIHFHSYPVTSDATRQKARRLARILARYQLRSRLVLVPFGDLQRRLVVSTPPPLRVVIYRRFMIRIAEKIARRAGARGLVTGEAIGQVASQTLANLATIDRAATLPVLRPLIGMDKEEIVAEARKIGTLDVSALPDEDCCQVFVPRHPSISVSPAQAEAVERDLPVDDLVSAACAGAEREEYSWNEAAD